MYPEDSCVCCIVHSEDWWEYFTYYIGHYEVCLDITVSSRYLPRYSCVQFWAPQNKKYKTIRESPKKGNKDGKGSGGEDIGKVPEFTWFVLPGEEKAEGRSHCSLQLPHEGE